MTNYEKRENENWKGMKSKTAKKTLRLKRVTTE
jgi:hypothetical protein